MEYYKNDNGILYMGDCIKELKQVKDKSQQAIIIDPPYNIGKDFWDVIPDYQQWMSNVVQALEPKLKDNGTFVIFHNDFDALSKIHLNIERLTSLKLRDFCVWNKRFKESSKYGYLSGYVMKNTAHRFEKMCEYFMCYTFDNTHKLKKAREERDVKQLTISKEILSKTGGLTGWYSNIERGLNMPTRDTIKPIEKHLGITFEDIVPKFNNQKEFHSVMNFDIESKQGHMTPKPIALLETILKYFTDEGDEVLDCFGGSGSLAVAAQNLDRKFTLIEFEEEYCEITKNRLDELTLF